MIRTWKFPDFQVSFIPRLGKPRFFWYKTIKTSKGGASFMSLTIVNKRCPEETNSDYAYRLIRRNIMNLYLKPGAVLNEAELSDQLGMSRTPIREALILLKNEGLVDIMPQRGSRVSHISLSLVREGYFMRRILETAIIREIAGALSSEQTAALKANLELQRQELARYVDKLSDDFFDLDDDMHRMLYEFSNRNHIWSALHGANSHYDRVRYLDTVVNDVDQSAILENHSTLYCYLLMGIPGDVDIAKFCNDHLGRFLLDFQNTITSYPDYFVD